MALRPGAVVVGAGPNGLAAAIELARAGWAVRVLEAEPTAGGGARTAELTLAGFRHDVCSAVHPLAVASPFFRGLALDLEGLEWIHPQVPLAHPMDDGTAVVLDRSVAATADGLEADGPSYAGLMEPLVEAGEDLVLQLLSPIRIPRHPWSLAGFGLHGLQPAAGLADRRFRSERARALFGGVAAHSMMPLDRPLTSAFAIALAFLAHMVGWPMPKGGSQSIADALTARLEDLGGRVETGVRVRSLDDLPRARATVLDLTPRQVVSVAGDRLPARYRRALSRYRYGPGVCKVDWALDGPIPWKAAECARAGTVHVGGSLREVAQGEAAVWANLHPDRPFVLLAQPSLFDPTRAPERKHTAWAYCHVPRGSTVDVSDRIEAQVERFAPGFRDLVLGRSVRTASDLERGNANYVGGDINGGVQSFRQTLARPVARWSPYSTPVRGLYLCSSSTPPGGGVHGMCGYHAARAVLRDLS